jgi:hypothetical protein
LNLPRSDRDIIDKYVSHTTYEDIFSFTNDLIDSGPLTYILFLLLMGEEDEIVEQYLEHDMPGKLFVSLSHDLLDITTEDIKQFVAIHALKQMSVFQEGVAIEINNEKLEDSHEWVVSENIDGLDSDEKETNDSGIDFDEHNGKEGDQNVNSFEIHND